MNSLPNTPGNAPSVFSPFWPLCLMAVSLVTILGWQTTIAVQQYVGSLRLTDQQAAMATQAAQAESKLQAMMTDLLQLSKTDAEAKTIVSKYRIKLNSDQPAELPAGTALPEAKAPTPAVVPPPFDEPPAATN